MPVALATLRCAAAAARNLLAAAAPLALPLQPLAAAAARSANRRNSKFQGLRHGPSAEITES